MKLESPCYIYLHDVTSLFQSAAFHFLTFAIHMLTVKSKYLQGARIDKMLNGRDGRVPWFVRSPDLSVGLLVLGMPGEYGFRRRSDTRDQLLQEIPEKTCQPVASSGIIPTCENLAVTPLGIKCDSPWWGISSLTTIPLWPMRFCLHLAMDETAVKTAEKQCVTAITFQHCQENLPTTTSSGTIPKCENPGVTLLGIKPGLPRWEQSKHTSESTSKRVSENIWVALINIEVLRGGNESEAKWLQSCAEMKGRVKWDIRKKELTSCIVWHDSYIVLPDGAKSTIGKPCSWIHHHPLKTHPKRIYATSITPIHLKKGCTSQSINTGTRALQCQSIPGLHHAP
ncbi:hypothetical protein PR048_013594 [Dryococelus australis]|uniref:Uncharacterized protein n=1 Tax=Dryococelus australis TaxID=614101 RepID=A0ABQ9HTG2_9NEOP|nr:hypothetical protein PR048_013594 [Dryococelus australis]